MREDLTAKYGTDLDMEWEREAKYFSQFPKHKYEIYDHDWENIETVAYSCRQLQDELSKIHNVYGDYKANLRFTIKDLRTGETYSFKDIYGCKHRVRTIECNDDCIKCREVEA